MRKEEEEEEAEGALFSVRCKLYYKKEEEYVELGVGLLRVEEGGEGGEGVSRRLLLRNDTALRTVLLNVRVNSDTPLMLRGNNVVLVSAPNPPLTSSPNPDPVTYLLRVKTADTASQLMKCIKPAP